MNKEEQEKIVDLYTVQGVPKSSISEMCKELGIDEGKLWEFLSGQTGALVGGEHLIYPWDIKRYINNLPNID